MMPRQGTVVADRYRLERKVGGGRVAAMWRVQDQVTDGACAIKLLHRSMNDHPEALARFSLEDRLSRELTGDYFPERVGSGSWHSLRYIAWRWYEGECLRSLFERNPKQDVQTVYSIVQETCQALALVHAAGYSHGDLKPENLFFADRPGDSSRQLKLLGFGVASRLARPLLGSQARRTPGQIVGTPLYLSPDLILGRVPRGGQADLWALAVIVYEALTGRAPFLGTDLAEVLEAILERRAARPSTITNLPATFDVWWTQALEQQFLTPGDFSTSLARALAPALRSSRTQRSASLPDQVNPSAKGFIWRSEAAASRTPEAPAAASATLSGRGSAPTLASGSAGVAAGSSSRASLTGSTSSGNGAESARDELRSAHDVAAHDVAAHDVAAHDVAAHDVAAHGELRSGASNAGPSVAQQDATVLPGATAIGAGAGSVSVATASVASAAAASPAAASADVPPAAASEASSTEGAGAPESPAHAASPLPSSAASLAPAAHGSDAAGTATAATTGPRPTSSPVAAPHPAAPAARRAALLASGTAAGLGSSPLATGRSSSPPGLAAAGSTATGLGGTPDGPALMAAARARAEGLAESAAPGAARREPPRPEPRAAQRAAEPSAPAEPHRPNVTSTTVAGIGPAALSMMRSRDNAVAAAAAASAGVPPAAEPPHAVNDAAPGDGSAQAQEQLAALRDLAIGTRKTLVGIVAPAPPPVAPPAAAAARLPHAAEAPAPGARSAVATSQSLVIAGTPCRSIDDSDDEPIDSVVPLRRLGNATVPFPRPRAAARGARLDGDEADVDELLPDAGRSYDAPQSWHHRTHNTLRVVLTDPDHRPHLVAGLLVCSAAALVIFALGRSPVSGTGMLGQTTGSLSGREATGAPAEQAVGSRSPAAAGPLAPATGTGELPGAGVSSTSAASKPAPTDEASAEPPGNAPASGPALQGEELAPGLVVPPPATPAPVAAPKPASPAPVAPSTAPVPRAAPAPAPVRPPAAPAPAPAPVARPPAPPPAAVAPAPRPAVPAPAAPAAAPPRAVPPRKPAEPAPPRPINPDFDFGI